MNRFFSRLVTALFLVIPVAAQPGSATAHAVPYFASGTAQFVSPTDFVGSGHATHLGTYTEVGSVAFAPTGNPDVLAVTGAITYRAANGHLLHAVLVGELNTSTGAIAATVTYVGGTGRFAKASGSSALAGQMLGGGAVTIAVAGRISY